MPAVCPSGKLFLPLRLVGGGESAHSKHLALCQSLSAIIVVIVF